jgi:DNA-binding NarL/FixJ family response regulator
MAPFEVLTSDGPVRDGIKSMTLDPGSFLIVDLAEADDQDVNFLEGVQFLSNVRTIFIAKDASPVTGDLKNVLPRSATSDDLKNLLVQEMGQLPTHYRTGRARGPAAPGSKRRGRPRGNTNDLPLAPRQYEIARLIASGKSNIEVAHMMNIQEQTVKNVMTTILKRLGLSHRRELPGIILGKND